MEDTRRTNSSDGELDNIFEPLETSVHTEGAESADINSDQFIDIAVGEYHASSESDKPRFVEWE